MTTRVLIVNHGPDPVLVRTVYYGPDLTPPPGENPKALDTLLQPATSKEFYVHTNQQLMLGEKRASAT